MLIDIPKMLWIQDIWVLHEWWIEQLSIESIQGQLPADSMNGFKDFMKLHLVFFYKIRRSIFKATF